MENGNLQFVDMGDLDWTLEDLEALMGSRIEALKMKRRMIQRLRDRYVRMLIEYSDDGEPPDWIEYKIADLTVDLMTFDRQYSDLLTN